MNTRHLESFIAVADRGSVSSAAQDLYISHTSLQQQINILEREAGFELFRRSHAGVVLTDAGKEFYRRALRILGDLEVAVDDCAAIAAGKTRVLRISQLPTRDSTHLCLEYEQFHPQVGFRFSERDGDCWEKLADGCIDFCEHMVLGDFDKDGVVFSHMGNVGLSCLMAPRHPLATCSKLTLADIAAYSPITCDGDGSLVGRLNEIADKQRADAMIEGGDHSVDDVIKHCAKGCVFISSPQLPIALQQLRAIELDVPLAFQVGLAHRETLDETASDFLQFAVSSL